MKKTLALSAVLVMGALGMACGTPSNTANVANGNRTTNVATNANMMAMNANQMAMNANMKAENGNAMVSDNKMMNDNKMMMNDNKMMNK